MQLPAGWGPSGSGGVSIVDHGVGAEVVYTAPGYTECVWGAGGNWQEPEPLCSEAVRYVYHCQGWTGCQPNHVTLKLHQAIESDVIYVRFAWLSSLAGPVRIRTYEDDGSSLLEELNYYPSNGSIIPGAPSYVSGTCHDYYWRLVEFEIAAEHNGYLILDFPRLGDFGYMAGLWVDDHDYNFPALCGYTLPTRTPTPVTPSPTPSYTPTGGWTPSPTITPTATTTPTATFTPLPTSPGQTATPSPTWVYATWTPAATYTPFPTATPLPGAWDQTSTPPYATPPGLWATPSWPTLTPIGTLEPLPGFTPDATWEAKVDSVSTAIAFGSNFQTRIYTMTNNMCGATLVPNLEITATPDEAEGKVFHGFFGDDDVYTYTGTITEPLWTMRYIGMPIAYAKGLYYYMPYLGPIILILLAIAAWRVGVVLFEVVVKVAAFLISLLARLLEIIGEYIPLTVIPFFLLFMMLFMVDTVEAAPADPVPTPELPTIPTAMPVPTLAEDDPQIDADLFWDIESWRTIISYARSIFIFAERFRFFTVMVVMAAVVLIFRVIMRISQGPAYYIPAPASEDED
jgi:hypothetical protein